MASFDTLIRGGTIVDGTRLPRYRGDIGIKDGTIVEIGRLSPSDAKTVLEADGLIVAPGGIDLHTHYDAQVHWDPYCSISCWHGVTSVTVGNCGFGFAPLKPKDAERAMLALSRNEAIPLECMRAAMTVDWESFPEYMDRLGRMPLGINLSHLLPISPAVAYVMGGFEEAKERLPDAAETREVVRLLREAIAAGAVGWSTQRMITEAGVQRDYDGTPMVSDLLPDEFYLALAEGLRAENRGFIEITQLSGKAPKHDFDFCVRLAEESGRPVLYNLIVINDRAPEEFRRQLQWLDEANRRGIPVLGQTQTARLYFRFTFEDWNLFDDSPTWREATLGTVAERKAKLADPRVRERLRAEHDGGTDFRDFAMGELRMFIAGKVRRADLCDRYVGRSVGDIAEREGKHPIDAMLDLTVADDLRTEWVTPVVNMNPEYHRELMSSPYTLPGLSDGGAHVKFQTIGTYPTDMLAWLVRDTGMMSLEEAHFRLSALPAWTAQFRDRGTLREGMAADVIVYDLANLKITPSEVVEDLPAGEWRRVQKSEGYRWMLVNGEVVFEDGRCTGTTPGKLLRHGRAVA